MLKQAFSSERLILAGIVLAHIVLGVLYAVLTPPWQVPDEPAHYNYVRYLAEERRLPVLAPGDYDQVYLEEIKSRRFDPALSVDPIRYMSHHPPLYYLLAVPVYVAFGGALVPLRVFSVLLGAGLPIVAYLVGKTMFPRRAWPALGTAALIAFIPQHVAMTAGVENDVLAELTLGLVLWGLVRWLGSPGKGSPRQLVAIGVVIGLALLTKTSAYVAVPLALVAVLLKFWVRLPSGRRHLDMRSALVSVLALLLPALILSLPWFARNAMVYGGLDITALRRHDQVVVGQLRTSEWITKHGWASLPGVFLETTFHSFWAQFGWMAVPIDARIYVGLALLSLIVALGFILWVIDAWQVRYRPSTASILLACSGLLTLGTYLGYNLSFYQVQGRYLFPALIPLGLAWSLGLHHALRSESAMMIGLTMALGTVLGSIKWLMNTCDNKWWVATSGLGVIYLGIGRILPPWVGAWLFAIPYLALALLCLVSPFWFIVPYLTP